MSLPISVKPLFALLVCVMAVAGCASTDGAAIKQAPAEAMSSPTALPNFPVGTILDVSTGRPVVTSGDEDALRRWMGSLAQADVVMFGEEHHNRHHVAAALSVTRALLDEGRRPVLAAEMFSWDGQAALDRQLSTDPQPADVFLDSARWTQNWGGPYADYAPLVDFAKEHRLPFVALNAPRPMVRMVGRQGLEAALISDEVKASGLSRQDLVEDPAYRGVILDQLKACHGGGGDDRHFERMYEASLFRDEAMARTAAEQVRRLRAQVDAANGPLVTYTGTGHIQYDLPIPKRLARRLDGQVKIVTIQMASALQDRADLLREWLDGKIADYIWLTDVGDHGPPARCR
ncbi:MAG: ChaN family lipoprotein [Nitrospiraceae bacterium]